MRRFSPGELSPHTSTQSQDPSKRFRLPLFMGMVTFVFGLMGVSSGQEASRFIHCDQFGYLPDQVKVAVLCDPRDGFNAEEAYVPSPQLEVCHARTDAVVYTGAPSLWNQGQVHSLSGDAGWWFDFSPLSTPGVYYILDREQGQRSEGFVIRDQVYESVLVAAQRMFFYNRCGAAKQSPHAQYPWTDGVSFLHPGQDSECRFVNDRDNEALEKDLRGGWFDAGDYNKYVTFATSAIHDLLSAYEENPEVFSDSSQIPESGNGVPDILDEVIWELSWLYRMSNPDGSVHIKMGSIFYDHNILAPPSENVDPRYYGPVCTSASIALASMFSHAALVFQRVDALTAFSNVLQDRAIAAWDYVEPRVMSGQLETNCDDGTIKSGDADWDVAAQRQRALVPSIYLYLLTGEARYQDYLLANSRDAESLSTGFWGPYEMDLNTALLTYARSSLSEPSLAQEILVSVTAAASQNWNGFFGFNESDLYRTFMPEWSYHWGSNSPKAAFGILNQLLIRFEILPAEHADFALQAAEHLHFFHGVNPLGLTMLSHMDRHGADRSANQIYHTWFQDGSDWDDARDSLFGPAPGYVVGGPNKDFSVESLVPPAGQPAMKSYLDFNDDWPNNSWEITEPAIYTQARYLRLLAHYVRNSPRSSGGVEPLERRQR